MAEEATEEGGRVLRFACSCVSAVAVADDPWANISKQGKLPDGTKELILNAIYRSPRTIAQLADELHLSQPTIHRHVTELYANELIREVRIPQEARLSSVERYYAPNFPVITAAQRQALRPVLEGLAQDVAETFQRRQGDIAGAFTQTGLSSRQEHLDALLHWLYTSVIRMARERLEEGGLLPSWPEHADGSRWLWWAEEPLDVEVPGLQAQSP